MTINQKFLKYELKVKKSFNLNDSYYTICIFLFLIEFEVSSKLHRFTNHILTLIYDDLIQVCSIVYVIYILIEYLNNII